MPQSWLDQFHSQKNSSYKILISKGELFDENRERRVPYKIYYPVGEEIENIPVIIWSHGFGGNRDGASFLSRYIASQGYILVHITHFGTDSSLWEGKEGHPWDILKKTKVSRQDTLDRFRDVPFVLDHLEDVFEENPELRGKANLQKIGMSGHSFGAMTTQVMAGMKFPDSDGSLLFMREPRFLAGILYSPVPIAHITDENPDILYGSVKTPLFHMSGTDDSSPIEGFDYKHRLIVFEKSHESPRILKVLQGGDHMIYNGTRGKLDKNPDREWQEEIIKISSLAYWDYYLKGNVQAKEWLAGQGYKDYIAARANITSYL